jgi:1,2-diacylglycerol 3-alpha-glucosyltransferase
MTDTMLMPHKSGETAAQLQLAEGQSTSSRETHVYTFRVCMLAACPFPANHGTPGSIREMSQALAQAQHEVHIVTYHFGDDIDIEGPQLHRITPLTNESQIIVGPTVRRPLYDLQMAVKAVRVVRECNADVLHAHGYEATLAGWLCRLFTGVPLVYSAHNTMSDELPSYDFIRPAFLARGLAKLLDFIVPRLADRCLPHSENIRQFLIQQGLSCRTDDVVNFGIEIPSQPARGRVVRDEYQLGDCPLVLYAGVMDRFQRLDLLLEAMAQVVNELPEARLCLVQTVPNDRQLSALKRQIERLGLERRVLLTPPQSLEGVRRFLAACDVAVVPRPQTPGFPIKLLNYMAAAKPVVLFASSANGLTHGDNAYLVKEDTSDSLASGILDLLFSSALRDHIGDRGNAFVRAYHDRRVIVRQIADTYERTITARHGRPCRPNSSDAQSCPTSSVQEA